MINNKQRVDEWINLDPLEREYHDKQWYLEKRSTQVFEEFCKYKLKNSRKVLDLGSGSGAPTYYFAKKNLQCHFTACDYSEELLEIGASKAKDTNLINIDFKKVDWYNMETYNNVDGIISLQTLSWLPEFQTPLSELFLKIKPKWIGLTSFFYEGNITAITEVNEHLRNRKSFYNTYSIPEIERFCKDFSYTVSKVIPFKIDINLTEPKNKDLMSTYTKTILESNERLQLCGPLIMHWKMLMIEKT